MIINKIHSNIHDSYLIVWLRWQDILRRQLSYTDLSILPIIRSRFFCKWVSVNFFIAWQMPFTKGRISKDMIRWNSLNVSISMLLMSHKVDKYRVCKYNRTWYLRVLGSSWDSTSILNEQMFLYAFFPSGLLVKQCFGFIVNNFLISCYPLLVITGKTRIWIHCQ